MCGISVVVKRPGGRITDTTLERMVCLAQHRGPDDAGFAFCGADGVTTDARGRDWIAGLGHRRLSIIDLTKAGHQPMRYGASLWLTYNGEIYNYIELREELASLGQQFSTDSDSEVILAAYDAWGVDAFRRLRGMWALAILDTARRQVVLSRDRLGIKPLYVVHESGHVAAASEIKQFKALPDFTFHAHTEAVHEYLRTGYEDPGVTLVRGVRPVPPGTWLTIELDNLSVTEPQTFWEPACVKARITDGREAAHLLRKTLRDTIALHLRSDVPVGLSLSGGLDSSAIAAIAAHDLGRSELHTFTCVFPGDAQDEESHARNARVGLTGPATYVTPTAEDFVERARAFTLAHDEPVGSLSVFAAFHLAEAMRAAAVPVILSGQGGDEALGGYWQSYWNYLRTLMMEGHPVLALAHVAGSLLPGGNQHLVTQAPGFARRLMSRYAPAFDFVGDTGKMSSRGSLLSASLKVPSSKLRLYEMQQLFLPRLLKWEDRNSMASGVEGRYPFLDHVLLETILSIDFGSLYARGWTKQALRAAVADIVPASIRLRRDKAGYEVPEARWLHRDLRPLLEAWLASDRPLWDHVDQTSARRLAQTYWDHVPNHSRGQALFRLYACDLWLEAFDVRW